MLSIGGWGKGNLSVESGEAEIAKPDK